MLEVSGLNMSSYSRLDHFSNKILTTVLVAISAKSGTRELKLWSFDWREDVEHNGNGLVETFDIFNMQNNFLPEMASCDEG